MVELKMTGALPTAMEHLFQTAQPVWTASGHISGSGPCEALTSVEPVCAIAENNKAYIQYRSPIVPRLFGTSTHAAFVPTHVAIIVMIIMIRMRTKTIIIVVDFVSVNIVLIAFILVWTASHLTSSSSACAIPTHVETLHAIAEDSNAFFQNRSGVHCVSRMYTNTSCVLLRMAAILPSAAVPVHSPQVLKHTMPLLKTQGMHLT